MLVSDRSLWASKCIQLYVLTLAVFLAWTTKLIKVFPGSSYILFSTRQVRLLVDMFLHSMPDTAHSISNIK